MPANTNRSSKKNKDNNISGQENQSVKNIDIPAENIDAEEAVFALDIGTRTVVGIVGIQENEKFKVLAAEVIEHTSRAMLDGQIHDINGVAEVVREVRKRLEKKTGLELSKVAIAAAGRVLKTCEVRIEKELDQGCEIDREIISSIEMEGIQKAQRELDENDMQSEKTQFYCVGYSVINYYLNGYIISTLLGHKGKNAGADILATFLPHIVVDSLYTVMHKVGLEVTGLTLEPIAAINVTIPKELRLLNLALVDIGAGTSDIAITRNGSVVAYAMVPTAGDEITERIAQHYLVDFNTAEKIKVSVSSGKDNITFIDILGKKQVASASDIIDVVKPAIRILAETIAQKIIEYNHKAPNAVFLIGGGSQSPGLAEMIAGILELPSERVAVRGREVIRNIKFSGKKLMGPEAITPFGIAVTAQMQRGRDFLAVTLNGKKIRMFNSRKLTVADALILIGFNPNQLIGRSGKSLAFELDGVRKVVRGEPGKPAEIFVNGEHASLETILNAGDDIRVIPSENGKNAQARISDFIRDIQKISVTFNNTLVEAGTRVFLNGANVSIDSTISDGDMIYIEVIKTLDELLKLFEVGLEGFDVLVNGTEREYGYCLQDGDIVVCLAKSLIYEGDRQEKILSEFASAVEIEPEDTIACSCAVQISESETPHPEHISMNVTVNGKDICIKDGKPKYIFVDIFSYVDFDLTKPKGTIVLKLNGSNASYTDEIMEGDVIEIYWEKM